MTDAGCLTVRDVPLSQWTDAKLADWINSCLKESGKYQIRGQTLSVWIGILRVFDICGTPMTVRQVFYQLETRGFVPKTENGYRQTAKHLLKMRKIEVIPYHFITDNTRWIRRPRTYQDLDDFLAISKETYRRSVWVMQPVYVEIWIEKEALIGVIIDTTSSYDVPLVPCKGYPSETLLYEAAEEIQQQHKPAFIYYFGDYDPTGQDIPRHIEKTLRSFGADFTFKVVAVTEEGKERNGENKTDRRRRDLDDKQCVDSIPAYLGKFSDCDLHSIRERVHQCIPDFFTVEKEHREKEKEDDDLEPEENRARSRGGDCLK
nr:hypothetical protein [Methanoregula sp.]